MTRFKSVAQGVRHSGRAGAGDLSFQMVQYQNRATRRLRCSSRSTIESLHEATPYRATWLKDCSIA